MTASTSFSSRRRLPQLATSRNISATMSFRFFLVSISFLTLCILYLPKTNLPFHGNLSYLTTLHFKRHFKKALRSYQRILHVRPLQSRAITAGIIFFVADVSSQLFQTPHLATFCTSFSGPRLLRYSLYGLFIMGPFLYFWYTIMNLFGPEDDFRGSLIKCIFEQLTLEPICIAMYIVYDGLVCRKGLQPIKASLSTKLFPLWVKNAVFWLPANFANYYIGTPDLRVVFANLCSLFWNIYFSGKINRVAKTAFAEKENQFSNHDRTPSIFPSKSERRRPPTPSSSSSKILLV